MSCGGKATQADGKIVHYVDFGSKLIEDTGSFSSSVMPDYQHPFEHGYEILAGAIEPKLKELL